MEDWEAYVVIMILMLNDLDLFVSMLVANRESHLTYQE